ncbi:uncharacterized protein LOC121253577 [Juglans microcarpa x Juglans regia]|uniref:uncharacterized protein LOC121253577 n=1 Tax=Juglans microcarpa x Juglans regia TaxID=2249226 RepID=UPI001B7DCDB4|nr:uncharacterized protein LOC121253577 [Juglans microcarpa x Juglans regia]
MTFRRTLVTRLHGLIIRFEDIVSQNLTHNEKIKDFDDVSHHLEFEAERLEAAKPKHSVYIVESGLCKEFRPKHKKSKIRVVTGQVKKGSEISQHSKRGATEHIARDQVSFVEYRRIPDGSRDIKMGNGVSVEVLELANVEADVAVPGQPKKRTFKKFSFRGVDLDALLDMSTDKLVKLFHARARRRFQRGLKRKPMALIKKLRKAKREAPPGEKPEPVRTHLRNMIIVPEIKPEMIGHYLAEFSISYKPVKHGRPGIGATHSSRFIPLK